jgi:hypothetical protein
MYIGKNQVDSIPLKLSTVVLPGYLGMLKRKLENKHSSLISDAGVEPEYFIYNSEVQYDLKQILQH